MDLNLKHLLIKVMVELVDLHLLMVNSISSEFSQKDMDWLGALNMR